MKRQLDKEERELSEKGVKRISKEINDLQDNLDYNKALLIRQKYIRDFDDKWREFLRVQKDEQDNELLRQMKIIIEQKQETLDELNRQLKEGVEKKTPAGVG